jgi:methylated-DNA-[protein]-cysteine S-methyltransferase
VSETKQVHVIDSPVGPLTLVAVGDCLLELQFGRTLPADGGVVCPVLRQTEKEVREFFAGKRQTFSIPLSMRGTPFQTKVWKALCKIPFGATCSYGELARRIGSPKSARAVGMALGRNPLAIVVPCHRVIGSSGALVGFGGGLEVKRRLLLHETPSAPR